jgi:hypothetical protein
MNNNRRSKRLKDLQRLDAFTASQLLHVQNQLAKAHKAHLQYRQATSLVDWINSLKEMGESARRVRAQIKTNIKKELSKMEQPSRASNASPRPGKRKSR